MAQFLRVLVFVVLVIGLPPTGPASAQPPDLCAEQSPAEWQQVLLAIRDDIRRLDASPLPDDAMIEEVPNILATKAFWRQVYVGMLEEYSGCLGEEPPAPPTPPDSKPTVTEQPERRQFIPYHDGVCVLRTLVCISMDGQRYSRPDSVANLTARAGQQGQEPTPETGSPSIPPPSLEATPQPETKPEPRVIEVSGRWIVPGDDTGTARFRYNTGGGPINGTWSTSDGSGTLTGRFAGTSVQNGEFSGTILGGKISGTWGGSLNANGVGSGTFSGTVGRTRVNGSWRVPPN